MTDKNIIRKRGVIFLFLATVAWGISFLVKTNFSNIQPQIYKYKYFNNLSKKLRGLDVYEPVLYSRLQSKSKEYFIYYKKIQKESLSGENVGRIVILEDEIPRFTKVGVIKYSEDSLLVKIKADYIRNIYGDEVKKMIVWVPSFTLYDTLPPGAVCYNCNGALAESQPGQ